MGVSGQPGKLTHVSFGLPLRGPLDDAALAWSFTELCGRHDTLRGTETPLRVVDLAGQPARARVIIKNVFLAGGVDTVMRIVGIVGGRR